MNDRKMKNFHSSHRFYITNLILENQIFIALLGSFFFSIIIDFIHYKNSFFYHHLFFTLFTQQLSDEIFNLNFFIIKIWTFLHDIKKHVNKPSNGDENWFFIVSKNDRYKNLKSKIYFIFLLYFGLEWKWKCMKKRNYFLKKKIFNHVLCMFLSGIKWKVVTQHIMFDGLIFDVNMNKMLLCNINWKLNCWHESRVVIILPQIFRILSLILTRLSSITNKQTNIWTN